MWIAYHFKLYYTNVLCSFDKAESFTAITKGGLTELLQKIRNVSAHETLLLRQSLSWIIFHLKYLVFSCWQLIYTTMVPESKITIKINKQMFDCLNSSIFLLLRWKMAKLSSFITMISFCLSWMFLSRYFWAIKASISKYLQCW